MEVYHLGDGAVIGSSRMVGFDGLECVSGCPGEKRGRKWETGLDGLDVGSYWVVVGGCTYHGPLVDRNLGHSDYCPFVFTEPVLPPSFLTSSSQLYITITHVLLPSTRPPYKTFALTICHFLFSIISLGSLAFLHSVYGEWPASATKARVILEFANFAGCAMLLIVTLTMRMSDPEFVKRMVSYRFGIKIPYLVSIVPLTLPSLHSLSHQKTTSHFSSG